MSLVLQVLFAFGLSGVLAYLLGVSYFIVAGLVAIVTGSLFALRERAIVKMTGRLRGRWYDYFYIPIYGSILGSIWPSLPFIIFLGRSRNVVAKVTEEQSVRRVDNAN